MKNFIEIRNKMDLMEEIPEEKNENIIYISALKN